MKLQIFKKFYFFIQGQIDRRRFGNFERLREASFSMFDAAQTPKIIWIYWHSGENFSPLLVRRCIQSWREKNPSWKVITLDRELATRMVFMDDYPSHIGLPERFFANLLRIRLLYKNGGVWVDATVFCHRPLDEWLPVNLTTGFFTFRHPSKDRWIETWFIASAREHCFVKVWEKEYTHYLKNLKRPPKEYFGCYYAFQWALICNVSMYRIWKVSPALPATPCLIMSATIRGESSVERFQQILSQGLPLSKLNWRIEDQTIEIFLSEKQL